MAKSLKNAIINERRESKLYSDQNNTVRENFNRSLQRYESFCDLKKWLWMPDYIGVPVQLELEEESRMLKINEINTKGLCLLNVPNFQDIRFHAGTTFADSRGCIFIGRESK